MAPSDSDSGATVASFKFEAIVFFLICALIAIGSLMLFAPRLATLRRKGILEYGSLAQIQSVEFHDKWILHREGREDQLLAAPEVTTRSNMATSFHKLGAAHALEITYKFNNVQPLRRRPRQVLNRPRPA